MDGHHFANDGPVSYIPVPYAPRVDCVACRPTTYAERLALYIPDISSENGCVLTTYSNNTPFRRSVKHTSRYIWLCDIAKQVLNCMFCCLERESGIALWLGED